MPQPRSWTRKLTIILRRLLRNARGRLRRLFHLMLSSRHSAHQIAAGAALGIFIGFTPLMGVQMIITAVLATFFQFSRIAAITTVYITNLLTAPIIYTACYFLGLFMLRPFGFRVLSSDRLKELFAPPERRGLWDSILTWFSGVFSLGWEGLTPLWLGCIVCGAIAAMITYYVSLRFVRVQRLLRVRRMARRARRRLERIREQQVRKNNEGRG
jgi:uncharacterized protein (DUF2062 family)